MASSKQNDKPEIGLKILEKHVGKAGEDIVKNLSKNKHTQDLARYIVDFAFGDVYNRGSLDDKQQEMVTIASLVSQGSALAELEVHIQAGLNVGLSQQQIADIITHLLPYVGFPKVIEAANVALKVFDKLDK